MANESGKRAQVLPELCLGTNARTNGFGRFTFRGLVLCRKTKASQTLLSRETLVRTAFPPKPAQSQCTCNQLQITEPVSHESENRESPGLSQSLQDSMRTQYPHFLLDAVQPLPFRFNYRATSKRALHTLSDTDRASAALARHQTRRFTPQAARAPSLHENFHHAQFDLRKLRGHRRCIRPSFETVLGSSLDHRGGPS